MEWNIMEKLLVMKTLLTILFILFSANIFAQTPTANAGADQTIYLTSTNSVTLAGTATNRSTSTWTEISSEYRTLKYGKL